MLAELQEQELIRKIVGDMEIDDKSTIQELVVEVKVLMDMISDQEGRGPILHCSLCSDAYVRKCLRLKRLRKARQRASEDKETKSWEFFLKEWQDAKSEFTEDASYQEEITREVDMDGIVWKV